MVKAKSHVVALSTELQLCVDTCLDCFKTCQQMALCVEETIACFLGCIAIDDREAGLQVGNMTRVCSQALPLGPKKDESGEVWLFLVR